MVPASSKMFGNIFSLPSPAWWAHVAYPALWPQTEWICRWRPRSTGNAPRSRFRLYTSSLPRSCHGELCGKGRGKSQFVPMFLAKQIQLSQTQLEIRLLKMKIKAPFTNNLYFYQIHCSVYLKKLKCLDIALVQ